MAFAVMPFFRLVRAGYVMAREGVFGLAHLPDLPAGPRLAIGMARLLERRAVKDKSAELRLSDAMNRLGPSYVKLGQFLATREDVVGKEAAKDLAALQDQLAPFDHEEARAAVAEQLAQPIEDVFVEFGEAVAAASIAQVHPAIVRDKDGTDRKVAVKVLRPGVQRRFQRDLESYYLVARLAERFHAPIPQAPSCGGRRHSCAIRHHGNGFPAGGRRSLGDGGEHRAGSGVPRAAG